MYVHFEVNTIDCQNAVLDNKVCEICHHLIVSVFKVSQCYRFRTRYFNLTITLTNLFCLIILQMRSIIYDLIILLLIALRGSGKHLLLVNKLTRTNFKAIL